MQIYQTPHNVVKIFLGYLAHCKWVTICSPNKDYYAYNTKMNYNDNKIQVHNARRNSDYNEQGVTMPQWAMITMD